MLELIFLSPLLAVMAVALIVRCSRKKPFSQLGMAFVALSLLAGFTLPLGLGVWIPDFLGQTRIIAQAESATGARFELRQTWNYIDFYTTDLRVTHADGKTEIIGVDGDASKVWSATLEINEKQRTAKAIYTKHESSREIHW